MSCIILGSVSYLMICDSYISTSVFAQSINSPSISNLQHNSTSLQTSPQLHNANNSFVSLHDLGSAENVIFENTSSFNLTDGIIEGISMDIDDESGSIYLLFLLTKNNQTDLFLTKSTDNGTVFQSPVRVNNIEGDVTSNVNFGPQIKVSNQGEVYVLWTKTEFSKRADELGFGLFGLSSLRIAKSTDQGNSFAPAVLVMEISLRYLEDLMLPMTVQFMRAGYLNLVMKHHMDQR